MISTKYADPFMSDHFCRHSDFPPSPYFLPYIRPTSENLDAMILHSQKASIMTTGWISDFLEHQTEGNIYFLRTGLVTSTLEKNNCSVLIIAAQDFSFSCYFYLISPCSPFSSQREGKSKRKKSIYFFPF
jgi:hypothetical protein